MVVDTRPLVESDLPRVHQVIFENRGHLDELGWLAYAPYPPFELHYRSILTGDTISLWIILVDSAVAGMIEAELIADRYCVGYWLGMGFRGRGIATRAVGEIVERLRETHTVVADTGLENRASRGVLERCGFVHAGCDDENDYWVLECLNK